MRYDEITPLMRKFVGSREAFRRLGFRAEDLYFLVQKSVMLGGALGAFVNLKTQGKEFNLELGPVPEGESEKARVATLHAEYEKVSLAINAHEVSDEDMDRMWWESEPYQQKAGFITALMNKGLQMDSRAFSFTSSKPS